MQQCCDDLWQRCNQYIGTATQLRCSMNQPLHKNSISKQNCFNYTNYLMNLAQIWNLVCWCDCMLQEKFTKFISVSKSLAQRPLRKTSFKTWNGLKVNNIVYNIKFQGKLGGKSCNEDWCFCNLQWIYVG